MTDLQDTPPILVLGGTGKTGRRVARRLKGRGLSVRIGSRSAVRRGTSPTTFGKPPQPAFGPSDNG